MESTDKKYYKIREVAEIIGVPASDIEKIRMVVYLIKEKGLKIHAAQEQIKNNHSGVSTHARAIERLKAIRNELQAMLDAMNRLR